MNVLKPQFEFGTEQQNIIKQHSRDILFLFFKIFVYKTTAKFEKSWLEGYIYINS